MNEEIKCDHKGKWGSLGTSVIAVNDSVFIFHNIFCKECGKTELITTRLNVPTPERPVIETPEIIPPKGLFRNRPQN